eukprot:CAMPEP_0184684672 /NCGR_PEP_ID=MMETSP0312-20130426/16260_1 /TAXON_ID=31354 /ORGANISM="Compsopogon coeruleus, Strain SAG 36.94" /LENGTH=245 /DNA_ID=CAMNT_0027138097 /DNA_START=46 /DNA_END=784 /DNA_ORIENTATION=+
MAAVAVLARRGTYVERPFDVYMCRTPCERQSGTEGAVLKKTPALTATTLRYSRVLSDEIASLLPQNFTMVEMEWSVDGDSIEEGNCCKDEGDFPQMMDPISSGTEEQGYPDMVQNKTFSSTGSLVSTDSLPGKEAADVGHYTLSSARISMSDLSNDSSEESRVEHHNLVTAEPPRPAFPPSFVSGGNHIDDQGDDVHGEPEDGLNREANAQYHGKKHKIAKNCGSRMLNPHGIKQKRGSVVACLA